MGFKQKNNGLEDLLHSVKLSQKLIDKLISLLHTILRLMRQLNMGNLSAYRKCKKALRMLEQLQHTDEEKDSKAISYNMIMHNSAPLDLHFYSSLPTKMISERKDSSEKPSPDAKMSDDSSAPEINPPSLEAEISFDNDFTQVNDASTVDFSLPNFCKAHPSEEGKLNSARKRDGTKCYPSRNAALILPARVPTPSQAGQLSPPVPPMNKVQFSAVVPVTLMRGEYAVLSLFMYEKAFHQAVEELLRQNPGLLKENRSGILQVQQGAFVRIELHSPDLVTDNSQTQTWLGEYLRFDFALFLPEDYPKRKALFSAKVFINDLPATRLTFLVDCATPHVQVINPQRRDVLSAFMSYAREDRPRAAAILLGMQKARPDLNVFFDVESLRSGDNWREALPLEISRRDIFFLCWSHYAKESVWVRQEWNCALAVKGLACIEPIPLESPDRCPPPPELDGKQFNDRLLYIINAKQNQA